MVVQPQRNLLFEIRDRSLCLLQFVPTLFNNSLYIILHLNSLVQKFSLKICVKNVEISLKICRKLLQFLQFSKKIRVISENDLRLI